MKYILLNKNYSNLILNKLKFKNLIKLIKIIISRMIVRVFSFGLKVPKWHLNATIQSRDYKSKVIKISNMYKTNFVIEIGCGIGEILGRLNASQKYGIDINIDTLLLCKRLNKDIKTIHNDIMTNNKKIYEIINSIQKDETILIIMVNWLHEYSESKVNVLMENLLSINRNIIIIADVYQRKEYSRIPQNKIVHKFRDILNNNFYKKYKDIDKVRDLIIISNKDIIKFY
tara:strand:- start:5302 stop:5988 length:687 start_codon:yes stop_codon:yes gene_type:complete